MITELCKRAEVEEHLGDNGVSPNNPIFPLIIRGEGALSKGKKRKIDLGKSVDDDIKPCRPSITWPFEKLLSEMRAI